MAWIRLWRSGPYPAKFAIFVHVLCNYGRQDPSAGDQSGSLSNNPGAVLELIVKALLLLPVGLPVGLGGVEGSIGVLVVVVALGHFALELDNGGQHLSLVDGEDAPVENDPDRLCVEGRECLGWQVGLEKGGQQDVARQAYLASVGGDWRSR